MKALDARRAFQCFFYLYYFCPFLLSFYRAAHV
nr:MAG TPA: hypothetical protein [Caudoviricetes sp.]